MNQLKQIIASVLIMTSLFSCSNEDSKPEEESVNNKWIVQNSTEFKSIEFDNNGNYIIIKNSTGTSKMNVDDEIFVIGT